MEAVASNISITCLYINMQNKTISMTEDFYGFGDTVANCVVELIKKNNSIRLLLLMDKSINDNRISEIENAINNNCRLEEVIMFGVGKIKIQEQLRKNGLNVSKQEKRFYNYAMPMISGNIKEQNSLQLLDNDTFLHILSFLKPKGMSDYAIKDKMLEIEGSIIKKKKPVNRSFKM
jgi:hypothetical protein